MPDQWSVWSSPGTAPADFLNNDNTAGAVQVPEIQEIDLLARALLNEPCGDPPAHLND